MSRLILGNCFDVLPTLEDDSVDVVIADPPYGDTSLGWDVTPSWWMPEIDRVLKPSGSVWCFGSLRMFMDHRAEFAGWKYAQEIVWEKHNGSSFHADRFKRVHELVVQWYRGEWRAIYKQPVMVNEAIARSVVRRNKRRPPHMGDIGPSSYRSEDGGPKLMRSVQYVRSCHGSAEHPTQKPTGVLRPLIEYSCPLGGVVLDPFAGSGSTGVAAQELGREYVLIEVDVDYHATADRRLRQVPLVYDSLTKTDQSEGQACAR